MREYVRCKIEVEFSDWDIDVVGVDTEVGVKTVTRLLKSLSISWFQRHCFEEDDHDQIQSPYLVCLTKAVDPSHLSFLVCIREDTTATVSFLVSDNMDKRFTIFCHDILPKFTQETWCPLLFNIYFFILLWNIRWIKVRNSIISIDNINSLIRV